MQFTRRQMLSAGVAVAAGAVARPAMAAAVPTEPSVGEGKITSQMRLSCAAYSFRDYLPHDGKEGKMTLHDFLDLAAQYRLDAVEPTAYYFSSEETPYLLSLKAKAFKLGLDVSGTAVGNNFCLPPGAERDEQWAYVKRWVDHAVDIGAPCIRVFAGRKAADLEREQAFAWALEGMKASCDYAGSRGVFLAVENHGYLTEGAEDVLKFLDAVQHEWFGVNLDTGNFDEKPYDNMAVLAPHAITVQVKVEVPKEDGKGREEADFTRIVKILRDANYRGYLALEYEAKEDPMTGVPKYLAKLREAITS